MNRLLFRLSMVAWLLLSMRLGELARLWETGNGKGLYLAVTIAGLGVVWWVFSSDSAAHRRRR